MANLAVKVADLDAACAFYEAAGAEVRDRMEWNNGERADVFLGPVMITLFTHAIYEDAVDLPAEGFLHPALFTDDLDAELDGHDRSCGVRPVVEGAFGKRRIAFVEAPGRHPPRVHGAAGGPGMKVTRFHHVSVNTNDAAARRRWSTSTATCSASATSPAPEIPGIPGHWHRVGDSAAPPRRRAAVGHRHRHDRPPLLRRGRRPRRRHRRARRHAASSTCARCRARTTVQIWITDPAGNTIELQQETRTP